MNLYNASKQWMNRPADQRFTTLEDLQASVDARRQLSRETIVEVPTVEVLAKPIEEDTTAESYQLTLNHGIRESVPTHWSFGQLSTVSGLHASSLRKLSAPIVADAINYRMKRLPKDEMKFMTLANDDGGDVGTLQAVTSSTYGRIFDSDVVSCARKIREHTDGAYFNPKDWSGQPSGLFASDRDVFIFMVNGGSMVDGGTTWYRNEKKDDVMYRGFIMWNSEVGKSAFGIMTFLFRAVCGNLIIWDAEDVNKMIIRHTAGGPGRFINDALPTLKNFTESSASIEEAMIRKAREHMLPDKKEDLILFGRKHKLTGAEVNEGYTFAIKEEGKCETLWDFVNGLTASAREYAHTDSRFDLEKRAGKLLKLVSA